MAQGQKSTFKDLFSFTQRAHVPIIVCAFFTAALVAGTRTAYAVLTGKIFELSTKFGAGVLPGSDFLSQTSTLTIYMCLLGLGMWLVASIDVALWVTTGELRAKTARKTLFASFLRKTMTWYDSRDNGMSSLMVGIHTQTRELQIATSQTLGYLVFEIFVFLACIGVAFFYSYKLTLVMLATGVPSAIILFTISRFLDPAIEGQKRELSEASKHATAAVTAIDLVKIYNGQDNEAFWFISAIRRSAKYYGRQVLCNCGQMSYIKFWMIMLFVIGFYFAVVLAGRGQITPGDALTTFYAVLIAFQSLEALGPQWLIIAKGMAAGKLLKTLASSEEGGQLVDKVTGFLQPSQCQGTITLTNVSFAYPSNPEKPVLTPSSFYFPAGQLTFVVGRSGSGKSTLANLLLRFYEPSSGDIALDGYPISALDLDWLRQNVTLIQQSSVLFNDTFLKNVAFGARDPDGVSAEEVMDACHMALLQSTVVGMPDGLDTNIGPSGYTLSGGQRQRLALARAKLRDPPVLILDEVTSGLDPVSRTLIMEAIRIWRHDKTTIIITHEVGHIENDEYVYVLEDGRIVQEGVRKALVEAEGLFTSLLASADDANSSRRSSSTESDKSDGEAQQAVFEENNVEPPLHHQRFSTRILHSLIPDSRAPTGLFHRLSLHETDAPIINTFDRRRRDSEAAAIHVVTRTGFEVQNNRPGNNQQRALQENKAAAASLESLEVFFLERLAKRKDKKRGPPLQGPMMPSLAAILRTVWPTLDIAGRLQLFLGLFSCVVIAASDVVFAFIFAQLLASFWLPEATRQEAGTKWAIYLTIVAAVDGTATFLAYFFMEHVAQRWVNALRSEAIKRILAQPKTWFDKPNHSPNRISQCLDRNAEEMRKLVGLFVPIVLTVTCMISAALVWALIIRWDLTLVTLAGLPVAIGTARANSLVSDKWESMCDTAANATATVFSDTFSNIRVVRALTLERYFTDKHDRSAASTYRLGVKRAVFVGIFYGLYQSISFFLTALVFWYSAKILSEGLTSVTDALRVVNLVLFSLGTSVAMLANVPQIAAAKTTAIQILHYANLSHTASHEAHGDARVADPLPVAMTNLQFAYPSAPKTQVLRNINLCLAAGTSTAIVGASGCGKSTLTALLLRLYSPTSPSPTSLTYASRPASTLSTPSLRSHIAYVPQHPFLFPATLAANITYGLHDASPLAHPAAIETAARRAGIHTFIASLPHGYATPVGEGGQPLSGGQAQRVSIARALVRKPKLLVLDEPTSALDAEGAEGIRALVRELTREGVSVVVVTHSKEMMRVVDGIVMLEGGRVVETGTYEGLVEKEGRFAALVGGGVWMGEGEKKRRRKGKGKGREVYKHEETLMALEGEGSASARGSEDVSAMGWKVVRF
ncbi:P-loop containing nucleoside triphosphate hydrolase protein [Cercophora newfieldiana]|uniref:P-loop containing nucleoside triphosphate hydrolase protein n=1 Tax=Cercophora newfieldiana TaxID=92897 RepID=A0AA40CRS8_9PEZI|nr:P-loop containing nucleoside triphosphate hydrolase protein [Cercophora newfieldiana]